MKSITGKKVADFMRLNFADLLVHLSQDHELFLPFAFENPFQIITSVIVYPNCKINLGLHILRKRPDGFHDLETVFYPVPLQDALEIIQTDDQKGSIQFTTSGLTIDAFSEDNICVKAYRLLERDFPLPSIKMHLHKTIPSGAGLGGGSADGAFSLWLLNKKFNLSLTEEQLIQYALQLGSDCPFFIKNKPCVAVGRGEQLQETDLDLSAYKLLLVNPAIHINTGWAFGQLTPNDNRANISELIKKPIDTWKEMLVNDFETPIFHHHPEIKELKEAMYRNGAFYASMSGSGSSVFGLFAKEAQPSFHFPEHYFVKWLT